MDFHRNGYETEFQSEKLDILVRHRVRAWKTEQHTTAKNSGVVVVCGSEWKNEANDSSNVRLTHTILMFSFFYAQV